MTSSFVGITRLDFIVSNGTDHAVFHICDAVDGHIHRRILLTAKDRPADFYEMGGLLRPYGGTPANARESLEIFKQLQPHFVAMAKVKPILMVCGPDRVKFWISIMERIGLKVSILRGSMAELNTYPPLKMNWPGGAVSDDEHILMFEEEL